MAGTTEVQRFRRRDRADPVELDRCSHLTVEVLTYSVGMRTSYRESRDDFISDSEIALTVPALTIATTSTPTRSAV